MRPKKTCKWYDACPIKFFYQQGQLDKRWVEEYCFSNYLRCVRYDMEEKGVSHPDHMLPDGTIDKALRF